MTGDNLALYREARDRLLDRSAGYDQVLRSFEWPTIAGRFNWAHDWFDALAADNDLPALQIVEEDGSQLRYSYSAMAHRSNQVATWLAGHGVRRGDSVLIMLGNQVELWESMLAVIKLGAVVLPTTPALGAAELTDRIRRGGVAHVIVNASDTAKFTDADAAITRIALGAAPTGWTSYADSGRAPTTPPPHPGTDADDRLLLYFTSGTTSRPKMVEHTHRSYPVGHLTTMYWLGIAPGDVHLNISSPGWAKHAWSCFFAPWIAGATIFIYNYSRFNPADLLDQIRRAEVTTFCAPPTVWRMLIKAELGSKPPSLREVAAAGEPLNPEVVDKVVSAWGLTVRDGFGQTETTALVANAPGERVRPGSMGRPLPGVPLVLIDPVSGRPDDHEGEICLDLSERPLNLMTGYVGDPERTAEAMAHGAYHTGDVAARDSDGYLYYIGRTHDVFKASDYKISPFELESVLVEHPAVLEAAVVPAPDPVRLAVPKAYIAVAPGWADSRDTALQILRHARENLAPYQRVRRLEFFDLPKTVSGKIRRVQLREREETDPDSARQQEWRDDEFPELRP